MLDWLFNHGTGVPAWIHFLGVVVVVAWAIWIALDIYNMISSKNTRKVKPAAIKSFVLIVMIYFVFAAMGPGTPPVEMQSDIGAMEYVDKSPGEKTSEQIQAEAEADKDTFLKKQDQDFIAEKEEADAILDEVRKRHQN